MIKYIIKSHESILSGNTEISSFIDNSETNIDPKSVKSFGEEWRKFGHFSDSEIEQVGNDYFDIVGDKHIDRSSTIALDVGCGSGRWSKYLANKVKFIEAIDPSNAVIQAAKLLESHENIRVTKATANQLPFPDNSFDFVFSLGVLHHIPDTRSALHHCIQKLKNGGFLLIYLYYNLDNRNWLYKVLFYVSSLFRWIISKLPELPKKAICDLISFTIYFPLSRFSAFLKLIKMRYWKSIPLSYYHNKSLNILRNDALDRFGTPLEQRFSQKAIRQMLESEGMTNIVFSDKAPYWHVLSKKG